MKKRNRNVEKDSISEFVASNVNKFRSVVTTHAKTTRDEDKTIQNASKKVASALGFTGGVMIAASFWSLLSPAIDAVEIQNELGNSNLPSFIPP